MALERAAYTRLWAAVVSCRLAIVQRLFGALLSEGGSTNFAMVVHELIGHCCSRVGGRRGRVEVWA